jgi:hypothetical protein
MMISRGFFCDLFLECISMTVNTASQATRLILGANDLKAGVSGRFNFHMLSPIMIGLVTPMVVIGLIDPTVLQHGRVIIFTLLLSLLLIATVLFAVSIMWPGEVTSVIVDVKTRKVEFVQSGFLANSSVEVHFDQIAAIGFASRYDRDGYMTNAAEIQLRDGQRVALPATTAPETLAAARRALGK